MVIGATSPKPEPRPSMKPLDPNLESQKIVTDPGPGSWKKLLWCKSKYVTRNLLISDECRGAAGDGAGAHT